MNPMPKPKITLYLSRKYIITRNFRLNNKFMVSLVRSVSSWHTFPYSCWGLEKRDVKFVELV